MLQVLASHISFREIAADLFLLVVLALAWYWPHIGERYFAPIEKLGSGLAERKRLAVLVLGIAAILIRLGLFWYLPIPVPHIQDEFSYLLAGDTFAHGRLTNPPHSMSVFFETIHVNQHPTYMSKYPPAQGAVLAAGQIMGHPWLGVLLSASMMCAAVLWMLQGWLPPSWALLGGVLVLLRLAIFSYWMNSYWGGAVPAIGGALVLGALPRIFHFQRARDAVLFASGIVILVYSRPYEGVVLCLPVMVALAVWLLGRKSAGWRVIFARLIFPVFAVGLLGGAFLPYFNWRGTGNALLPPYVLNDRTYYTSPFFIGEKPKPQLQYTNPQFDSFYNTYSQQYWLLNRVDGVKSAVRHLLVMGLKLIYFFMWPELCILFLALPWVLRDRRTRLLVAVTGFSLLGSYIVIWFLPHYAAPLTAALFALLLQSMRHMRRWEYAGRQVGIGLTRAVVLCALVLAPLHPRAGTLGSEGAGSATLAPIEYRALFAKQLANMPGEHLAIVRYAPGSDAGEWVYNGADIDHSKIVWAREIPGADMRPLLNYFRGRHVWLVEPGANPPRLNPYPADP